MTANIRNEVVDATEELVTMYRPTGPKELELVAASGWRRWPPRLPEQPIFYPVTNQDYAEQIARDWNVPESGAGFVLRFNVRRKFMERFEIHKVGSETHTEWWIPAEDLEELNDNIVGKIDVVARFPIGTDIVCPAGFPRWSPMKSGARALVLQPCTISEFAESSGRWIEKLGLQAVSEGITSDGVTAMMTVTYRGELFWLATDIWLNELALEPQSLQGDAAAAELFAVFSGRPD